MKNLLLILFVAILPICSIAQSAKGDQEITGGIGSVSGLDMLSSIGYNKDASNISRVYHYIYGASYKYYLKNKLALGIGIAQHSYAESYYNTWLNQQHSYSYDALSICAELKGIYGSLNRQYFQLYYSCSLGIMYCYNPGDMLPSLYYSPLGLRIGNQNALFLEFGIGYKGLVHAGYSYRWKKTSGTDAISLKHITP